eukprot:GHVH01000103.1.p1 GENE.GHVH01000103.1~~GHVH01000103.1.p1  ORF type:complete len:228 (+),score=25.45 GHVH01000103.1:647-1330(+)
MDDPYGVKKLVEEVTTSHYRQREEERSRWLMEKISRALLSQKVEQTNQSTLHSCQDALKSLFLSIHKTRLSGNSEATFLATTKSSIGFRLGYCFVADLLAIHGVANPSRSNVHDSQLISIFSPKSSMSSKMCLSWWGRAKAISVSQVYYSKATKQISNTMLLMIAEAMDNESYSVAASYLRCPSTAKVSTYPVMFNAWLIIVLLNYANFSFSKWYLGIILTVLTTFV